MKILFIANGNIDYSKKHPSLHQLSNKGIASAKECGKILSMLPCMATHKTAAENHKTEKYPEGALYQIEISPSFYVSPFQSAIETFEFSKDGSVNFVNQSPVAVKIDWTDIVQDPLLADIDKGTGALEFPDSWVPFNKRSKSLFARNIDGESMSDVYLRAQLFLLKIEKKHKKEETVVVFSHCSFIRAAIMVLTGKQLTEIPFPEPCQIIDFEI